MKRLCKLGHNKYFIMAMFLMVMLGIHFFFYFSGDDVNYFSTILDSVSLKDFIVSRYNTWSSRIFIEMILIVVSRNIYLWRILDVLVIGILTYSVNKIFFKESNYKNILFTWLLFLLYPMLDMCSAGFAATTTNYLWCLSLMMFAFIPYRNIYYKEKINIKIMPLYIVSLIYACNQEQAVCIIIIISIIYLIYCIKKKLDYRYVLGTLVIALISLIFIITCPGNELRSIAETGNWYPEYVNLGFLDKIYLGIVSSLSILADNMFILWFLSLSIMIFIIRSREKIYNKILSIGIFLGSSILIMFRFYTIIGHKNYALFNYYTSSGEVFNIMIFIMGLVVIGIFIYLLYVLFKRDSLPVIGLLLIGGISRVMMGFSPTIFASGSRTMIFLYWALLLIILLMFKNFYKRLRKRDIVVIFIVIIGIILLNYARLFLSIYI